jgi:hypothetical protein
VSVTKLAYHRSLPSTVTSLSTRSTRRAQTEPTNTSTVVKLAKITSTLQSPPPKAPSPIPDLIDCSDSDDDDYVPHYILDVVGDQIFHYDYIPMPAETTAPALFLQDHKAPPILTPGALTPALLRAFQIGSMQYFAQKNIERTNK